MRDDGAFGHQFVNEIPAHLEQRLLYISIAYATTVHRFPSCDREVVVPLTRGGWHLRYDGESVSLAPSIAHLVPGCNAHYWIRDGQLVMSGPWRDGDIEAVQTRRRNGKAKPKAETYLQPQPTWRDRFPAGLRRLWHRHR